MLKDPKLGRIILAAVGGSVVILIVLGLALQDLLFRMAVTPPGHFLASPAPPSPDYSKAEAWALRPAQPPPGGWEKPWGVDVFFIHPASAYAGDDWNAKFDDKASHKLLSNRILPNHAGPFLQAAPVYAPHYRQASLHSEIDVGGEGDGAFLLAYNDILAAFDHYMSTDNRSRGIILTGVGQGGLYVQQLLHDRFQAEPLKERLAAAYIIDAALPADALGRMFEQSVCQAHDSIHCVIAWRTVVAGEDDKRLRQRSPIWGDDGRIAVSNGRKLVCVNPILWVANQELALKEDHRGGAKADGPDDRDPQILRNAVSARCQDGVLEVERPSAPELQARDNWGGRYKTPEFNLFYEDILANAAERARVAGAWLDEHGQKPAEPLPPTFSLGDAPIHREGEREAIPPDPPNPQ